MGNIDGLIRRAFLSLEDGDYEEAEEVLDQALNKDPENPMIYLGLLCAELKVNREEDLAKSNSPISSLKNFKRAIRFGDSSLVERLNRYNQAIINIINSGSKEEYYLQIVNDFQVVEDMPQASYKQCMEKIAGYKKILEIATSLEDYKDVEKIIEISNKSLGELEGLSKQRKNEEINIAEKGKKRKKKGLQASLLIAVVLVVGIFSMVKFKEYKESLPGKYDRAYHNAWNDGDWDGAKKYYKKYLDVIKSDDGPSGTFENYEALCDLSKTSLEGLEAFVAGDYDKSKELFSLENEGRQASIYYVPLNHIKTILTKYFEEIDPLQIQITNYPSALYWLNADGTVGTLEGESCVEEWQDIVEIKVDDAIIAGLQRNGRLFYKIRNEEDIQVIDDVKAFELEATWGGPSIVAIKNDGSLVCNREMLGSNIIKGWRNIKAVRIFDRVLASEHRGSDGIIKDLPNPKQNPYLVAQTEDGKVLTSGYNIKVYKSKEASEEEIIKSLQNAPGWDDVLDSATRNSFMTTLSDGYVEVKVPASLDANFDEQKGHKFSLYGTSFSIRRNNEGIWEF